MLAQLGLEASVLEEEAERATTGGCALELREAPIAPGGAPAVLDLPEVRAVACGQDGVVEVALGGHAGHDAALVVRELVVRSDGDRHGAIHKRGCQGR